MISQRSIGQETASAPTVGRAAADGHGPLGDIPTAAAIGALAQADADSLLSAVLARFPVHRIPLVTSFAPEGMVILDMITRRGTQPRVVTLDTGYLHPETVQLFDVVQRRFGIEIEVIRPDEIEVDAMVQARGERLFYASVESRLLCCEVRKVHPLRRALDGVDGWITGLRRDQTDERQSTPKVARDPASGMIWKVAPLADWTADQVWSYVRARDLPYNPLHDRGFASIGCAPCTRAIGRDEPERAGRWWWEHPEASSECGLHLPVASTD